jgi:hypothetical protein
MTTGPGLGTATGVGRRYSHQMPAPITTQMSTIAAARIGRRLFFSCGTGGRTKSPPPGGWMTVASAAGGT